MSPPVSVVPEATTSMSRFRLDGLYVNGVDRIVMSVPPKAQDCERLPLSHASFSDPVNSYAFRRNLKPRIPRLQISSVAVPGSGTAPPVPATESAAAPPVL